MEAQHNLSKVLQQVEEGQTVYITRRKKIVAKIVPAEPEQEIQWPDFAKRARKTLGEESKGASMEEILDEIRGDR